jgi:hypothetical protein
MHLASLLNLPFGFAHVTAADKTMDELISKIFFTESHTACQSTVWLVVVIEKVRERLIMKGKELFR